VLFDSKTTQSMTALRNPDSKTVECCRYKTIVTHEIDYLVQTALTVAALLCVPFARVNSSVANAPAAPTVNSRLRDIFRGRRRNS
jgi:hypothetical protein